MKLEVNAVCYDCKQAFLLEMEEADYHSDLRNTLLRYATCPACERRRMREYEEQEHRKQEARRRAECAAKYAEWSQASRLDIYALGYDPADSRANPELFRWVANHKHECLWIAGKTGLCKSRILQYYARQALYYQSVQYWCTMDLLNHLAENAKNIDKLLWQIYRTDLLILDDLGKENVSPAKMKYLFNILDRRYSGLDQYRRGFTGRILGWQVWISTNDNGSGLMNAMGADGAPVIRRLQEMCEVWDRW